MLARSFVAGQILKHARLYRWKSTEKLTMADSILVTNVAASRGTSPVVLSLLDYLQRKGYKRPGYFIPIATPKCQDDEDPTCGISARVDLVRATFGLDDEPSAMIGVLKEKALDMLARGERDALGELIFHRYAEYRRKYQKDIILIEGAVAEGLSSNLELNGWLANDLAAPVLMIYDMNNDDSLTSSDVMRRVSIAKEIVTEKCQADLAGLILNRVPRHQVAIISEDLRLAAKEQHCAFAGAIPYDEVLSSPRLNEVVKNLRAEFLFGSAVDTDVDISTLLVAAQDVSHLLDKIDALAGGASGEQNGTARKPLVLTTPDRTDVLLALGCAHASMVGPNVAGVVLCDFDDSGEKALDRHVKSMYASFDHVFPVYGTPLPVNEVIETLARSEQSSKILASSNTKIERAKQLFSEGVDMDVIAAQLSNPKRDGKTPKMFLHDMYDVCRQHRKRIVLPEAFDPRILRAAAEVTNKGLAGILLLGNEEQVRADAARYNADISKCDIMDYRAETALVAEFAAIWTEERKAKGATFEQSVDLMADRNVFGTMLCKTGKVDGMVSGAACTTAATIRPALTILRKQPLVSSVFLMCLPERVLVFGDCAVNVDPTPEQLSQIAATAAETALAFDVDPRIAMISYSTGSSGSGPMVEKVQLATDILKRTHPELKVEGPVQYDAAINEDIAKEKIKARVSDVAGHATVLIFPDLNTGNATYKAVQQSSKGVLAIGPLLQGLKKPVNDLSRGATVPDIVNTICSTSMQAMKG